MKAITVYHPWAELIALNEKRIETRSWETKYRGPLAIHVGTSRRPWHMDLAFKEPFFTALKPIMRMRLGQVIAVCNLVDCLKIRTVRPVKRDGKLVNTAFLEARDSLIEVTGNELIFGDYTPGRYAWILRNIQPLKNSIGAKGMQRIWNWDSTPHEVTIDYFTRGNSRIWTPKGILTGRIVDRESEDTARGLEI